MFTTKPTPLQSAAAYCQAHARSYIALSHEIAAAPTSNGIKDLDYCQIKGSAVIVDGKVHEFKGMDEAYAFILRMFW